MIPSGAGNVAIFALLFGWFGGVLVRAHTLEVYGGSQARAVIMECWLLISQIWHMQVSSPTSVSRTNEPLGVRLETQNMFCKPEGVRHTAVISIGLEMTSVQTWGPFVAWHTAARRIRLETTEVWKLEGYSSHTAVIRTGLETTRVSKPEGGLAYCRHGAVVILKMSSE